MDAKHGNELVVNLLEELKKRKVKIPTFSKETGIPKDRIYKWIQEGNNPKADDEKKIYAWIKMEKAPNEEHNGASQSSENAKTLTEALAIIKQQNAFLQRMIESNLNGIARDLNTLYNEELRTRAEVRGYSQRQIYKEVNWDTQKFLASMAEVGKLIEANLKSDRELGNQDNASS
jgi:DNA-binding phage protein